MVIVNNPLWPRIRLVALLTQMTRRTITFWNSASQGALFEAVADFFTIAQANQFARVAHIYVEEADKEHHRLKIRRYHVTENLFSLPDTQNWEGSRGIGMLEHECLQYDTRTVEQCYFTKLDPSSGKAFFPCSTWTLGDRESPTLALGCRS
jgi:hypothetical protein